ncbi:unnamed protein product [Parnassius mnemosyne]|uniref:Uncharacterized protein n=1 Tax=Parnassius mnemosyne TaxID=213953 RepID=A0AAV1M5J5_9NEOP
MESDPMRLRQYKRSSSAVCEIVLKNSTGQERLNGLALISIRRRIDIETEEVIDLFTAKKARGLNLIL